jgi:hypothetical protein
MRLAGTTRLVVYSVPLGISIFAASWAATREFMRETADPSAVAAAVQKLARGEVLREARPPAAPEKADPDSPHAPRRNGNAD